MATSPVRQQMVGGGGNESVHDNVINDPVFSPDSKRVAYVMLEGNQ
jgi:hypothetical protein